VAAGAPRGRRSGKDQQVEDSHLGEPEIAPRELLPDRPHRRPVAVEVAFVAAHELERTLPEQDLGPEVVVLQVLPDDAVEQGDQRRALRVQRLRHLREADPWNARERVEELP
jgi:hypothetical protein